MDNIKMNMERIWKSKCKYLVIIAFALILVNGVNLLQTSLKFLNPDGEEAEEIKSVEIESDDWVNKEPGSFHITKSADWTGYKEATIRFDINTRKKLVTEKKELEAGEGADVILVLDNSGSMKADNKIDHLKESATELVNQILSEENHTIALITFNWSATLSSTFTNDKSKLLSQISSLSPGGSTNFIKAYKEVISLLSGYKQSKNRDLVMLFLTDGAAASAKAQYQILKDTYDITIVGIQYGMGSTIKKVFYEMTDKQYLADNSNISSMLFQSIGEATDKIQLEEIMKAETYETFEIEDYVSKEFKVKSVDDIQVSKGTVELETLEDGTQKILWKITDKEKFATGTSATMSIKTHYQGELNADRVYPTNQRESIKAKLPEEAEKTITSELTPQLRTGYYVTYDPNLPSECNKDGEDLTEKRPYWAYDNVEKSYGDYTCPGWQIKEWRVDEIVPVEGKVPSHDVRVAAIWTKTELTKSMEGKVYEPVQELLMAMKENEGVSIPIDTEINFDLPSSETNGRGLYVRSGTERDNNPIYYYRGAVANNNVLFAGICWQIVRTTENGGIKLIYNGVSSDGKSCSSTGDTHIGESAFNTNDDSIAYVGYMYGTPYTGYYIKSDYTSYVYGKSVTYDSATREYTLVSTRTGAATGYHYTCKSTRESKTCSTVYYLEYAASFESGGGESYYLELTGGDILETVKEKMFTNTRNSTVKTKIDAWYKTNIEDRGYTKYLDVNTVWCNDRTMTKGGLMSEDAPHDIAEFSPLRTRQKENNPALKDTDACPNINDRFTTDSASSGNKVLMYPVGMLTADEVMSGGLNAYVASTDSYLYTKYGYWTMTPNAIESGNSRYTVYNNYIYEDGGIRATYYELFNNNSVKHTKNVRPSISLKPGTLVSLDGDGTIDYPYTVIVE